MRARCRWWLACAIAGVWVVGAGAHLASAEVADFRVMELSPSVDVEEGKAAAFPKGVVVVPEDLKSVSGPITVREAEPNGDAATATPLGGGSAVALGNIYPNGDLDYYSFSGAAGDRVYAAVHTAFSSNGSYDSYLTLFDTDGSTVIEFDNDDGSFGSTSSSIAGATLPAAGTYYIQVRHNSATSQLRPYTLYFRLASGAPTAETEPNDGGQALPAGGWVSGETGATTDVDIFTFDLAAGDTVFLSLDLDPERDTVEWNGTVGVGPFDGYVLIVNDAGTATPDSEAMFMTVKDAGTYYAYVAVPTGGTTFGTYNLSVAVFPASNDGLVCTTYTSTDVPQTIPDGPGVVTSTITVPGNPRIADLDVAIDLTHALMADLDVNLVSPADNDNGLFNDIGATSTGGASAMNLVLDDEAGTRIGQYTVVAGMAYQPEYNYRLSWFDGEDAGGTWTLTVRDDAASNGGTLNGWSITVCEAPPTCPPGTAPATIYSADFELDDGTFTHSGTQDEWQWGSPSFAPITTCASGVNCWATDLTGTYNASSSQDLVSPVIDLTGYAGPIIVSWAQRYQLESASFDHAWVDFRWADDSNPTRLFEWLGATMTVSVGSPSTTIPQSAGWGVFSADMSAYAGQQTELVFHLDSDSSVNYAGLAIDDVSVVACVPSGPPDIDVTPTSLAAAQDPNTTTQQQLTLSNVGSGDLVWELFEEPAEAPKRAVVPQQPPAPPVDSEAALAAELTGGEDAMPKVMGPRDPAAAARARRMLLTQGLLLIPDSTSDRVMAFDPITGDLVDADFIPADPTNLSTPKSAILSAGGTTVLVSDQIDDVVQEYDLDGNYVGVFAPAGGVNNAILDNIVGIDLRPNGNLLVTVQSGANADSVAEFDTAGNYLGNFIANVAGGLDGPFDVFPLGTDWLVPSINTDNVLRFDATGAPLGVFAPAVSFGEQVNIAANGNVLVANFSTPNTGVMEFTPAGALVGVYSAVTGNRGVYELPNGNILTSNGSGVHEIDRSGNLVATKYAGTGAQYIELAAPQANCTNLVDVPWLSASPIAGTTPAGGSQPVDVTFDSTGLAAGLYGANLCALSNDPDEPVVQIPVSLEVLPVQAPAISLAKTVGTTPGVCATTDSITVSMGTTVYYCYEVTNTGTVPLSLHDLVDSELGTIFSGLAYALAPGASVNTVDAGLSISVVIDTTTTNSATWTAYNAGPTDVATATDTATVTVELAPDIDVSPSALASSLLVGTTDQQTLTIANTGNSVLSWNIDEAPATAALPPAPLTGGDAAVAEERVGDPAPPAVPVDPTAPVVLWERPQQVLFDNGPLVTHPGGGAGGADASALQTALGMNTLGAGAQVSAGNRVADDFTVDTNWTVETITFFTYQTGSTTTSTINALNVRIWDGAPDDPASTVVWGDTTTNVLTSTAWSNIYRVTDTTLTTTNRPIMTAVATVNTVLPPGTYWVDWQIGGTLSSGPWVPPVTILGQTTTGNAKQFTSTGWANLTDTGTLTPQGMPFIIEGTSSTCFSPSDIPWLSASPISGSTPAAGSSLVDVTFDATAVGVGSYDALLCVFSDDPDEPLIEVPVHMEVVIPVELMSISIE